MDFGPEAPCSYNGAMSQTPQTPEDANQAAARVVAESTDAEKLPPELEAAWEAWSKGIQNVDTRGMTLLRAAFEAGWGAAEQKDNS